MKPSPLLASIMAASAVLALSACGAGNDDGESKIIAPSEVSAPETTSAPPAATPKPISAGERVFGQCRACHSLDASVNRMGPTLDGLFGRTAGTLEGFRYSEAMIVAGREGLVWDEANFREYMKAPKTFIKNNSMGFVGIKREKDIDALIDYLSENTAPYSPPN